MQAASSKNVNYGVGDGLVMIDGKLYSNNCNCTGNSRPVVLKLDGSHSSIEVLHKGESVVSSVSYRIKGEHDLVDQEREPRPKRSGQSQQQQATYRRGVSQSGG